jgi:hypothetical protein
VPLALAAAVLWGPAALAAPGGPAVTKVLTTCTFTALKNAVAAGGTIDYGINCTSPPVSFAATIQVPSGRTADIEANGHTVAFDDGNKVRLFQVTGGHLTIGGISLNNAAVSTASGTNGGTGANGTSGAAGSTGANGAGGTSPGQAGSPGQPGGAGGTATAGKAGVAGKNATLARGAALLITSGTVTLTNDGFSNDVVTGGNGGSGGAGGSGGSGGDGGVGGIGGAGAGGAPTGTGGAGGAGGQGGNGAPGGAGGAGGKSGAGGAAQGGAVWNAGTLTVSGCTFSGDQAVSGNGGSGGPGGLGGHSGGGGNAGSGGSGGIGGSAPLAVALAAQAAPPTPTRTDPGAPAGTPDCHGWRNRDKRATDGRGWPDADVVTSDSEVRMPSGRPGHAGHASVTV